MIFRLELVRMAHESLLAVGTLDLRWSGIGVNIQDLCGLVHFLLRVFFIVIVIVFIAIITTVLRIVIEAKEKALTTRSCKTEPTPPNPPPGPPLKADAKNTLQSVHSGHSQKLRRWWKPPPPPQ